MYKMKEWPRQDVRPFPYEVRGREHLVRDSMSSICATRIPGAVRPRLFGSANHRHPYSLGTVMFLNWSM